MELLIIGCGGHANVVAAASRLLGFTPKFITLDAIKDSNSISEADFLSTVTPKSHSTHLICGVGSSGSQAIRKKILSKYAAFDALLTSVIHPAAHCLTDVLGNGIFIAQGANVVSGTKIANHVIINTGAIVDHDCVIGLSTHVATGAALCGNVHTEPFVHIGANATIVQGVEIAEGCVVGAGAVVTSSIREPYSVWVGAPARKIKELPQ